jgi:hypothetical protein
MFLGFWTLGSTLAVHVQLAAGNAPVTADAPPTFRIYSGASNTPIATGSVSAAVDSLTGWHLLSTVLSMAAGFGAGVFTIRLAYSVGGVAAVQEFVFEVV